MMEQHFDFDFLRWLTPAVLLFLGAWIQLNLRTNTTQQREQALRDRVQRVEEDLIKMQAAKADKERLEELKSDMRHTIDEFKADINKRLDLIYQMLSEMQKKIM